MKFFTLYGTEKFIPVFKRATLLPVHIEWEAGWTPKARPGRCGVETDLLPLPEIET